VRKYRRGDSACSYITLENYPTRRWLANQTTMANQNSVDPQSLSREPRRSGRRSVHSHSNSTSTSRSLHSPPPAESRSKDLTFGNQFDLNGSGRNGKGLWQDDFGDRVEDSQKSVAASSASSSSVALYGNRHRNRKGKEKSKSSADTATPSIQPTKSSSGSRNPSASALDDDEDEGVTRCICESDGKSFLLFFF
jgi:hypothetical protein